jgi:plastocyanin
MDEQTSRRGFLKTAGVAGGAAAATGTATAQEGGATTVTVSSSNLAFEPETVYVTPGTTVRWEWEGSLGHNIEVRETPSGASWEGHPEIVSAPETYEHTFETMGKHNYVCTPHEASGMVGDIIVNEAGEAPEAETRVTDPLKTLGVATVGTMSAVLVLTYFFIKYGGDYADPPGEQ